MSLEFENVYLTRWKRGVYIETSAVSEQLDKQYRKPKLECQQRSWSRARNIHSKNSWKYRDDAFGGQHWTPACAQAHYNLMKTPAYNSTCTRMETYMIHNCIMEYCKQKPQTARLTKQVNSTYDYADTFVATAFRTLQDSVPVQIRVTWQDLFNVRAQQATEAMQN